MTRYAIIDIRQYPMTVIDIVDVDETVDVETGDLHERLQTISYHLAVASDEAQIGWTYSGSLIASNP
ncbi:hypothetical protein F9K79_09515 [Ochrobactrum sp. Kaboul]|nr:hypothetical protein F9K79_09515 [Ochrobactrum sp. Kaboul]